MVQSWLDTHIHVSDISPEGHHRDSLLRDLLEVLDRSAVDLRFVLSCDFPYLTDMIQDPVAMVNANRMIHELVREAPERLYGSCLINPNFLEESLRVMDQCFGSWGFVQFGEMLQYMMNFKMDSKPTEKLVRHAIQFQVPVQVHISTSNHTEDGSSWGVEQLLDLLALAERVPEAKYILAHAVGDMKKDPPVVDQYLDILEQRFGPWPKNFWIEIRDVCSPGVQSVLARVPTEHILIGTDWTTRVGPPFLPYGTIFNVQNAKDNPYLPCVESMVSLLQQAGASEEETALLGFDNASKLLLS